MKYCVIKNTATVIDGSDNADTVMIQNAANVGFTADEIEILAEEEYQQRLASIPQSPKPPTQAERIEALEAAMLALLEV